MSKTVKEPYLAGRVFNRGLGIVILALIVARALLDSGKEIFEMLIFALAAVENFSAATICFLQHRKVRGNVYAIICAVFLIIAAILAVRYFVFV